MRRPCRESVVGGEVAGVMATAFLFPGQGAQTPEAAPLVREHAPDLLETCIAALGEDPLPRCEESTRFAQPAIVLASLAGWRAGADRSAAAFAGHSLGELSALAAAGVLDEHEAVRLAVLRGGLMADADGHGEGGMLALLGGTMEQATGPRGRVRSQRRQRQCPGPVGARRAAVRDRRRAPSGP